MHTKDAIWAFELQQRAGEIRPRLPNRPALKFVPGPLPEPGVEPTPATVEGPPPVTLEERARAAEWAAGIADPELRKLVEKAARISLARRSG